MQYYFDTVETVPEGVGFSVFGPVHLSWLVVFLFVVLANCVWYGRLNEQGKALWRKIVASLIALDEVFKMVMLSVGRRYTWDYLPLHLCSINIFLIVFHAWKPGDLVGSFLYTVCIPGAMAALLFPSWSSLPFGNFMHLHSFTIHILLALYPAVLAVNGEIEVSLKSIPRCLLLLGGMAAVVYLVNLLLDTNYMFLMLAEEGNPLYFFEKAWGNHLLGYPLIIVGVLVVMYAPVLLLRKLKINKNPPV